MNKQFGVAIAITMPMLMAARNPFFNYLIKINRKNYEIKIYLIKQNIQ